MALSMDEQRILAEIEQGLASADPVLAARLGSFGRLPGGGADAARLRRTRMAGSAAALVAVALVSIMVYTLIPFRALPGRTAQHQPRPVSRAVMTASSAQKPVTSPARTAAGTAPRHRAPAGPAGIHR